MKIETIAARASHAATGNGAVTAPIELSTTFERAADGSYPGFATPVSVTRRGPRWSRV